MGKKQIDKSVKEREEQFQLAMKLWKEAKNNNDPVNIKKT